VRRLDKAQIKERSSRRADEEGIVREDIEEEEDVIEVYECL